MHRSSTRSLLHAGPALLAVALLLAWAGPAEAQRTRYKRDVKIKVKVKQTDKTKKLKAKSEDKSELKPQLSADDFLSVLGKVGHLRASQIQALKLLIDDTDNDNPELPDLHFRLGEMYSQQSRYWNFRGMEMHDKINRAKTKSAKSSARSKQKKYFNESKKFLIRAIKQYKNLFCHPKDLKAGLNCKPNPHFRNYPRMDTALFYFAFTLQTAKQMTDARKVYARLVKDYPKSKHIPDAFLSFAEYYFAQGQLANAERFYDKVLKFPKAPVYTYALYKKGWVFLNLDRNQEAYEVFTKVAKMTNGKKGKKTINLAAKKDSVRAYSEMGRAETAYKAFQRVDRKYAPTMLQILGGIYLEKGKAAKAIYTYRELIGILPKNKLVCEWQYNVGHAMLSIGDRKQKVDEIENLVKLHTFLKKKKAVPEAQLSECYENAIAVNSEMAKLWHNEATKTLNIETLAYVERLYHMFLNNFPESSEYGEMQYYYAELLWQRAQNEKQPRLATEKWEKAAAGFTDVVKLGKVNKKLLKESAYAAVLGWKNALDVDPRKGISDVPTDLEGKEEVPKPKEIPARQLKMIDAFDIYITYVKDPKDEELVMMKFLKARLFWRYNHFDKAVPLFEDIVKKHHKHETAEFSINLLLDTFNRTKNFEKMIYWVNYLLDNQKHLKEKEDLWARLNTLKRQSMRKQAETLEKDKKYVECGTAYLDIFNMDPNSNDAHEVLYNAGVCFQDGMSMGAARRVFGILSQRYPKEKVTKKAIARLGYIYGRVAWYDKAARKLEEYAKKFGGEKDAYKALNDAVFYYKGIGEDDNAIRSTKFFVKQYAKKKPKEAANAYFSLVTIYEKLGDKDKVVGHLRSYLKTHGRKGGVDRQIIAHVKIGKILWRDSCPLPRTVEGACVKIKRERAIASKRKKKRRRKKKGADLPTQCGPESKVSTIVRDRDRGTANRARKEFLAAVKLFKGGKALAKVPGEGVEKAARQERMVEAYAAAKFHLAEQAYEDFLAIKFPTKLNFDPKKKKKLKDSQKRFNDWVTEKKYKMLVLTAKGGEPNPKKKGKTMKPGLLREVIGITGGGADWAIAAAARAGQVSQNFSDALFTASIPKNVRTGPFAEDMVFAYCDKLTEVATPLEDTSIGAFSFCLETSTSLNWFNSWSKLCERELGQIRPEQFPTAAELHVEAEELAPVTDVEPAQLELTK